MASEPTEGPLSIFTPAPERDRWEMVDGRSGEVISVSAETEGNLLMGALGALLGELLSEEELQKVVTVSPLPPGAGT